MAYYIGIDGGGTKTEAAVCGEDAHRRVAPLVGGPTNPYANGRDNALHELTGLLDRVFRQPELDGGACAGVCLGIAGVATPEERAALTAGLQEYQRQSGRVFPFSIRSEMEISLMAALDQPVGIAAISGTGSISAGYTADGRAFRAGGWGHLLGDEGSGYRIGLLTLQAAMRSHDRVYPPTAITEAVKARLGLTEVTELKTYIYQAHITKRDIAAFAELCIQASAAGDAIASEILRGQATELADTTAALMRQEASFGDADVVTIGSIFKHGRLFRAQFLRRLTSLYPQLRFHEPTRSPAEGAALLARLTWPAASAADGEQFQGGTRCSD
ncbi:N-acetylglucosamine kinase [Cohnella sp. REN36]|uniref:N-acetylglucosamine kinase n=1 Tax=Cohnella sp. REN36 TaxID=2887347 RepID=UPI001D155D34|nr:BadF/BadG/BcrA/BcrD ATPase family protein [Cohnella sp. REN36]MCC3376707.1 N-acetylglucosamine kinase [Cohnella sp. REN36]